MMIYNFLIHKLDTATFLFWRTRQFQSMGNCMLTYTQIVNDLTMLFLLEALSQCHESEHLL